MIEYPSIINSSKAPRQPMIAFEKLDGSNIRVKYTAKRGFDLFGSRTQLLDETHPILGGVVKVFNETCKEALEEYFRKYYPNEREMEVFGEYVGPNSFAGFHSDPVDKMRFVLFDVMMIRKGYNEFLLPQEFVKLAERNASVPTPRVIYEGNLTDEFISRVRADEFGTFEGVVCKGKQGLGSFRGKVWMCKIKTNAYLQLLKEKKGADWVKFAE